MNKEEFCQEDPAVHPLKLPQGMIVIIASQLVGFLGSHPRSSML